MTIKDFVKFRVLCLIITPYSYYVLTHVQHGIAQNKLQCEPGPAWHDQEEHGIEYSVNAF